MSAGDTDKTKPRKQFLNVVYFVDSSRTKTLKIPMSRVYLALFCALLLVGWAISSTAVISLLVKDRTDLALSLRQSMQTIFDFESLHDGVYETAYPAGKLQSSKVAVTEEKEEVEKPVQAEKPTIPAPAVKPVEKVAEKIVEKEAEKEAVKAQPVKPVEVVKSAAKDAVVPAQQSQGSVKAEKEAGTNVEVVVSNPVVKTTLDKLSLTFDLTNKDDSGKTEGYLWATAEFKTDTGETHILKAPTAIAVDDKGGISDHKLASYFAIRRFKRNEFSFDLVKGHSGTVVGVKIGISDKPGANRMIYDVPLGIKIGASQEKAKTDSAGKKAGQG